MSTGLECMFIEPKPNRWYYVLQDWSCPVGAWDWREYAKAYGPFRSENAANEHLRRHHANPGGSSTYENAAYTPDETLDALICVACI